MARKESSVPGTDPEDVLRALLRISPEDAEAVRDRTPGVRPEKQKQDGPTEDYGDGTSQSEA